MANSKIYITFFADFVVDDYLQVTSNNLGIPIPTVLKETWKTIRNAPYRVSIGSPTAIPGERSAINFVTAFNLDYNSINLYTVARVGSDVVITANVNTISFSDFESNRDLSVVEAIIVNNAVSPISIDSVDFSPADSPCENVKITVETDVLATKILSPVVVDPNTDNPFEFEWPRGGGNIVIQLENADGEQASQEVSLPPLLNASNFEVAVNGSPNGSTAIVIGSNSDGLDLEYSLDDAEWQDSNVFSGLAADDYTLYVRDQFGCSFELGFTVNETGIYTPHFYISKSNSIRFAQRVEWGDSANYKTDENTLSYEADVKLPHCEAQQFQTADVITTQFQSNFQNNVVKVIKEDGSEVAVTVEQKTQNIGRKDKRDAKMYDYGSGQTGIYFTVGNTYDYDTDVETGTYALNGTLPVWARPGNYISIDSAWYIIEDIVFDESKNADVILISSNYTDPEASVIVGCIYNFKNYEVYEFGIDMADYQDQTFQVNILASDERFDSIGHLSEKINVAVRHPETVEIRYWNTDNTDVFYATGIRHLIRIPKIKIGGFSDDKFETYKTDSNAILISAEVFEGDEFIFDAVTKEIMRKILLALSHENVYMDGVGYVKNDSPDVEGPLDDSNLYAIKAKMIKSGYVYNSQSTGSGESIYSGESTEIPGLIEVGDGFVRY